MMTKCMLGLVSFVFFLSGAAALIYQVVWVRSLSLIFGGSHLAVTVVLSIFMAGLAAGGYTVGKFADRVAKPLRLYGLLELGIAVSAVLFVLLMKLYPSLYIPLAQGRDDAPLALAFIRVFFSTLALIVPTTLMGGTLPVLSRFVSGGPEQLRTRLSLLYAINTLGAVAGAAAAGFFLLRLTSVSMTLRIAIAMNVLIGAVCILLKEKAAAVPAPVSERAEAAGLGARERSPFPAPATLVLWGIGVSGFCALGYEVLWSRILTIVIGASVYGFTVMLIAFLTGIALGSEAYGLLNKIVSAGDRRTGRPLFWFGAVQVAIGVAALLVTVFLRDIPTVSVRVLNYFAGLGLTFFEARTSSQLALAFLTMVVPAFFMGLAFPLAGALHAERSGAVGGAVGEVLAYNTVGAILGAAVSGFALLYLFGIERSLQMLTVVNLGAGAFLIATARRSRPASRSVLVLSAGLLLFLALDPGAFRVWDMKYFAIFRNNQPEAFRTPEMVRDAVENTDVLYYAEGVEAIVSSIKVRGGDQAFLTNGRIEASSQLQGQQCQYALGHLPMLLNRDPRKVLVVGTGSGMTLGATSAHPGVEEITIVELEPAVLGVARTFEAYNHRVLDDPRLRIVFNDGRNFLMTTKQRFDVITADPIHPWFRGAGYLYTTEYFKLASGRLTPGGVMCQWLPLYELTTTDLRSVVRTFGGHFRYTMLWMTHYDAELIGSNEPITIDTAELERRIAEPAVAQDLSRVMMGSPEDLLSYFVMGTKGMREFSRDGVINTDDNLYLEFSAPFSIGRPSVMEGNVNALIRHRESVLEHLIPPKNHAAREKQKAKWEANTKAADVAGRALALFLGGKSEGPQFSALMDELDRDHPSFAPGRFLQNERLAERSKAPTLLKQSALALLRENGEKAVVKISAVLVPVSSQRAAVMFVDNDAKVIYGQFYVSGSPSDGFINRFVDDVMMSIRTTYQREAETALNQGAFPAADPTLRRVKDIIALKIQNSRFLAENRSKQHSGKEGL